MTERADRSDDDALRAIKFLALKAAVFMMLPAALAAVAAAYVLLQ